MAIKKSPPSQHEKVLSSIIISSEALRNCQQAIQMTLTGFLPIAKEFDQYIRSLQPKIVATALDMNLPEGLRNIHKTNAMIAQSIAQSTALRQMICSAAEVHSAWQAQLEPFRQLSGAARGLECMVQPHMASIMRISLAAQEYLSQTKLNELGVALGAGAAERAFLQTHVVELTQSYAGLFREFQSHPEKLLALPPAATSHPSIEVSAHADLLCAISSAVQESDAGMKLRQEVSIQIASSLEFQLSSLNPDLLRLLKGAREALHSKNPDKVRHAIASLRELLTSVLHQLAPDEDVERWTNAPDYFHDGRPTRRARIYYICNTLAHPTFSHFLDADVRAAEAVFDLCQKGTHSIKGPFSDHQLSAIVARAEGLLHFWLELVRPSQA